MMYNVGLQYAVLKIYEEFPFFFFLEILKPHKMLSKITSGAL